MNSLVDLDNIAQTYVDELDTSFVVSSAFSGLPHGVSILVKDSVEATSVPSTQGMVGMAQVRPAIGATVIAKLKAVAAITFRRDERAGFFDLMVKLYAFEQITHQRGAAVSIPAL
ncbi:MAG: hypothetical protein VCB07_04255 [Gammaproteobacteria bacterium]